jgi:hypothetical protein
MPRGDSSQSELEQRVGSSHPKRSRPVSTSERGLKPGKGPTHFLTELLVGRDSTEPAVETPQNGHRAGSKHWGFPSDSPSPGTTAQESMPLRATNPRAGSVSNVVQASVEVPAAKLSSRRRPQVRPKRVPKPDAQQPHAANAKTSIRTARSQMAENAANSNDRSSSSEQDPFEEYDQLATNRWAISPADSFDFQRDAGAIHTPEVFPHELASDAQPIASDAGLTSSPRPKFIFRPAVPTVDSHGRAMLRPDVFVTDVDNLPTLFPSNDLPSLDGAAVSRLAVPTSAVRPASAAVPRDPKVRQPTPQQPMSFRGQRSGQVPSRLSQHTASAQPLPPPARMQPDPAATGSPMILDGSRPFDEGLPPGAIVEGMPEDAWMPPGEHLRHDGSVPCGDCVDDECRHHPVLGGMFGDVLRCLHGPPCYEGALGIERVMHAPFFIDTTQPLKNCRVRFDFAYDHEFPDRAEYFWAKINPTDTPGGRGPASVEPFVDYQDLRFYIERGTKQFSVGTEIPIRILDPAVNDNESGLADMNVASKTVLLDGRRWQLTQVFRSYFPTGSPKKGLGTGHVSLEPGVAYRYKLSEITYFHGDLKYWFPLGGHSTHAGEVLQYGFGMSHVLHENDYFAVIPTLELVGWSIFDGDQTVLRSINGMDVATSESVDGMGIANLYPGVRFAWDNGSDCSTRELGISAGIALSDDHWYDSILRVELRWSF